jgi:hypothetical protein
LESQIDDLKDSSAKVIIQKLQSTCTIGEAIKENTNENMVAHYFLKDIARSQDSVISMEFYKIYRAKD